MMDIAPQLFNLGSTGLKAYSSIQEGNEAARVARENSQAAANAQMYNAAQVRRETARREELTRRQGRSAIGKQTAAMAEAGILGSGTAVGVLDQSAIEAELDALNVRYEGETKNNALMFDARNTLLQGRNQAYAAKKSGLYGAAGLLAQGAANAYGLWQKTDNDTTAKKKKDPNYGKTAPEPGWEW